MGFIFGIINLDGKEVRPEELEALSRAIQWEGALRQTDIEGNVAFGFCHHPKRSPRGGSFKEDGLTALADIRIYNRDELADSFDYTTPEQGFAKAYQCWGLDCAQHINGDFAAVVIDRRKNEVHLFRDHIGARPLAYWFSGNRLIFASHEFALAGSRLFECAVCEEKLIDHIFFYVLQGYSLTAFQNIFKVVPGHSVSFSLGQKRISKYWKPEEIKKNGEFSFEDSVARLRELIVRAVIRRIEPGRMGMHVSGGLDSCGVASIVAEHVQDGKFLAGYSYTPEVFEDPVEGLNEKEFIDAFIEAKKIPVQYCHLQEHELIQSAILPEFEAHYLEHPIMRMAERDNVEVLFSGLGGDQFVSLSTRGIMNHLFFSFKWPTLLKFIKKTGIRAAISRFRMEVVPFFDPFALIPVFKAEAFNWSVLRFLKPAFVRKHWKRIFLHRKERNYGYGDRTRFAINQLETHLIPRRIDSCAIHAERYGFEYRYPLLDKDVLEFWFAIPVEHTYWNFDSRLLFREAMNGILPEKIRLRRDKEESLRMASTLRELETGHEYLKKMFHAMREQDHIPFFKSVAFESFINSAKSTDVFKNAMMTDKLIIYMRYVALTAKYIVPLP
jgi:asparagine synthase (glutamine-hydrolysing)